MNTNRREFITLAAASAAGIAFAGKAEDGTGQNGLALPEGKEFAGMDGAFSAMFTPFTRDGKLNEGMIDRVVEYGISKGLKGFYLTGSTGEGFLLSIEERIAVYRRVAKAARGRAKLIAHVGCMSTQDSVTLARAAADAGMDWVSSVAPVYFGQDFTSAYEHYRAIAEATDLPFLVYSIGKSIEPDRDRRLFDIPNVKGMKYTGYAYWSVQALKHRIEKPAIFFAGADEQVLSALACRNVFSGCIGTTDNFIPEHFVKICRLAQENRFAEAGVIQDDVVRLVDFALRQDNASCWKLFMRYIGLDCGFGRAPNGQPVTDEEYETFARKVDALGILRRNGALA